MKINFFAPINNLGYGQHSYGTIKAFEARGHKVCVVPPFGQVRFNNEHVDRWINAREHFDANNPGVMIFNEEFLTQFCGRPRIGFPVFETEKFIPFQLAGLRSCDYLMTPTQWGKSVLEANGLKNIYVVNEGFDPEIFPWIKVSDSENKQDPFTFLHVGKFEERKGTLQIIRCFFKALENESARLVMHVDNPFTNDYSAIEKTMTELGFISTTPVGDNPLIYRRKSLAVIFSPAFENHFEVANLYQMADAAVFASRAEGWGLCLLESIVSGIPTIVGNWTGPTEYLSNYYPELLTLKGVKEKAKDSTWFIGDRGDWTVPTNESLEVAIKIAFHRARDFRKTEEWKNHVAMARCYTWDHAAKMLEYALQQILGV